ncbi:MAG: hypothetical protein EBV03_00110 [Proteobacteria bacterium]|nr:hypothetical protein [Pseudomonadota bacterium]
MLLVAGVWAGHNKWGVVRVYDALAVFIGDFVSGKDGLTNPQILPPQTQVINAEKMAPGDTLITRADDTLTLIDAQGLVRHTWHMPFYTLWSKEGVSPPPGKSFYHFREAQLYPNGDVLALYHDLDSGSGVGLVKLDKDSKPIWSFRGPVHDGLAAYGDRVYTLINRPTIDVQTEELAYAKTPAQTDDLLVLSAADGAVKDVIPLLESFIGTPFEQMIYSHGAGKRRYMRAVSVQPLPESLADKFPMFEPGFLLISFKNFHAIGVLDPVTGKLVWAMRSIWSKQDKAVFGNDGSIWVYDSHGYFDGTKKELPRLVQINPADHTLLSTYLPPVGRAVGPMAIGNLEQLPGGNLLVTLTEFGKIIEITPQGEVVWQHTRDEPVHSAARVAPGTLPENF